MSTKQTGRIAGVDDDEAARQTGGSCCIEGALQLLDIQAPAVSLVQVVGDLTIAFSCSQLVLNLSTAFCCKPHPGTRISNRVKLQAPSS